MITVKREDFEMLTPEDRDSDEDTLGDDPGAERLAEYRAGGFHFVGVQASVTVRIPCGKGAHAEHVVTTPGLWGVESDSPEYHKEVFKDECDALADMLRELGVLVEGDPAAPSAHDTLCLARSLIRDAAHGWAPSELAAPPADVARRLTSLIGDEYDFATGDSR